MPIPKFVLASASPARRQLLQGAGIEPVVIKSNFDESQVTIVSPAKAAPRKSSLVQVSNPLELVQTLAYYKAKTVVSQLEEPALILGCDSVLVLAGEVFGKPTDAAEAIARWQQMRASFGELYTGHALIDLSQNTTLVRYQVTGVYFADISDRQIQAYVATGEPLQCAGGFALEGKGGIFVDKLEGCHTNVIGLSLPLLRQMLSALGYDISDFWHS
jgi:septum formation protein